jgi:hypothetical protein
MVIVFFLMAPFAYSVEKTQGKDVIYHEVRVIDSTITGISNPAGLSFSPKANNFQIMNANNPSGQTVSTFTDLMSVTMDEKNNGSIHIPAANLDPVNSTYDEQLGGLLILDRSRQNLVIVPEGSDSKLLPSKLAHHDIKSWKLDKPMGMTVDQARGQIFILDQSGPALHTITAAVTDSKGVAGSASVTITVNSTSQNGKFTPTDDAKVSSINPNKNYGSITTLEVRKSSYTLYSYLKFNVTGLSGTIKSAKIRLYPVVNSRDGGSIYAVSKNYKGTDTPWLESGLTYNNAPSITGESLSTVTKVTAYSWVDFDVTAAITGNGEYSFAIANTSSQYTKYNSCEAEQNQPVLIVNN